MHIGAFNVIEDNVKIGNDCSIGNHNTICRGTTLGSNCTIYHNNSIATWLVSKSGKIDNVRLG